MRTDTFENLVYLKKSASGNIEVTIMSKNVLIILDVFIFLFVCVTAAFIALYDIFLAILFFGTYIAVTVEMSKELN